MQQITHFLSVLMQYVEHPGGMSQWPGHLDVHLEVFQWKMRVLALCTALFVWMSVELQPKSGLLATAQV